MLKILTYKILKILTYEILKILIYGQTGSPSSLSNVQIYFLTKTQRIFDANKLTKQKSSPSAHSFAWLCSKFLQLKQT